MGIFDIFRNHEPARPSFTPSMSDIPPLNAECTVCGAFRPESSMHSLYDGIICKPCFDKIGPEKYTVCLSVREARLRISLWEEAGGDWSKVPPFPYQSWEAYNMSCRRDRYIRSEAYEKLEKRYQKGRLALETQWTILRDVSKFYAEDAAEFEKACLQNIKVFEQIYTKFSMPNNTVDFSSVPAYKYLAMLYDRQKKYDKAVAICLRAINHKAPDEYGDGGNGKMINRLARMAKKAKMTDDREVRTALGLAPISNDDMPESTEIRSSRALSSPNRLTSGTPKEILHTRWGDYEMPNPYKIVIKKGPRTDLKKI